MVHVTLARVHGTSDELNPKIREICSFRKITQLEIYVQVSPTITLQGIPPEINIGLKDSRMPFLRLGSVRSLAILNCFLFP